MTRTQLHKVAMYTLPSMLAYPDHDLSAPPTMVREPNTLSEIATQLPAAVWTTDAELCFTSLFGAACNQLNLLPHQVLGMPVAECFPPDSQLLAAHRGALGGHAMTFELDSSEQLFHGVVEPLFNEEGGLAGTVGAALNISERQRAEVERLNQIRQSLQADKVEAMRRLAGGIAHNFNNLLTAVIGYTALALHELPVDSPVRSYLSQVEGAAQAAADLTRQMLNYGQREPRRLEFLNLSQVIEDLRPVFEAAVSPGVALSFDLANPLPVVLADGAQIREMVKHLLFNASEALADSNGVIRMRTQVIHADRAFLTHTFLEEDLAEGEYVWLQVSDTGCGMDAPVKAHIFEPFFSTKFTGRGLGLAAVQGIVRAHQGAIAVSSKPGLGTSFHILLPCLEGVENEPRHPTADTSHNS